MSKKKDLKKQLAELTKRKEEIEKEAAEIVRKEAEEERPTETVKQSGRISPKMYNLIYDAVIIAGVLLLAGGGYTIYHKYAGEKEDKEMYESLNQTFLNESTEDSGWNFKWGSGNGDSSSVDTIWYKRISVDFDGLNTINEDVVGWLFFENEDISYPILYSGDDEYYLHHTLYKNTSTSASIFVEGVNNPDMQDDVTIIYGHNMKNSSMFGKLRRYKEDEDYYDDHQYFQVLTEDGKAYRYRVFSYFDIDQYEIEMVDVAFYNPDDPATAVTEYREVDRTSELLEEGLSESEIEEMEPETEAVIVNEDNTYENYLKTICSRSLRDTGIGISTEDKVVALFTCSTHSGNRLIVYGVRVAEHDFNEIVEEETTDIRTLDR